MSQKFDYLNIGEGIGSSSFTPVHVLPIMNDNFCHIVSLKNPREVAIVDPGEASGVLRYLRENDLTLKLILVTHKHHDHVGGISTLIQHFPETIVYATSYEEIPHVTRPARDGEIFFFDNLKIKTRHVPCHTRGHVVFFVTENDEDLHDVVRMEDQVDAKDECDLPAQTRSAITQSFELNDESMDSIVSSLPTSASPLLFSGDTLFVGGCGRFFEGNSDEMSSNMLKILQFPLNTLVYCAHEYTESNMKFLASLKGFKTHHRIQERYLAIKSQRQRGQFTVPSNLLHEINFNLFLTCHNKEVKDFFNVQTGSESIAILREMKNNF